MLKDTFFLLIYIYIKKTIDKERKEEKITTFMGNTTPTTSATQKDKCEGMVVESELLYAL